MFLARSSYGFVYSDKNYFNRFSIIFSLQLESCRMVFLNRRAGEMLWYVQTTFCFSSSFISSMNVGEIVYKIQMLSNSCTETLSWISPHVCSSRANERMASLRVLVYRTLFHFLYNFMDEIFSSRHHDFNLSYKYTCTGKGEECERVPIYMTDMKLCIIRFK